MSSASTEYKNCTHTYLSYHHHPRPNNSTRPQPIPQTKPRPSHPIPSHLLLEAKKRWTTAGTSLRRTATHDRPRSITPAATRIPPPSLPGSSPAHTHTKLLPGAVVDDLIFMFISSRGICCEGTASLGRSVVRMGICSRSFRLGTLDGMLGGGGWCLTAFWA